MMCAKACNGVWHLIVCPVFAWISTPTWSQVEPLQLHRCPVRLLGSKTRRFMPVPSSSSVQGWVGFILSTTRPTCILKIVSSFMVADVIWWHIIVVPEFLMKGHSWRHVDVDQLLKLLWARFEVERGFNILHGLEARSAFDFRVPWDVSKLQF